MDVEEQRRLGVRLAKEGDAPKTLEAVKNLDSTLEDILNIAVNGNGVDHATTWRFKYQPGGPTRTIKTLGLAGHPNFSYP